ncbi:MAG: aldehyde dehydrogenase family protein [Candidatus Cloacimonetes bacterium]|nr:aldehyde dehydrogenase family protein [Candidatus Cloacimonadota bacterium]
MIRELKVVNPYTQAELGRIPIEEWAEVDKKLAVAHNLFLKRDNWLPAYERVEILERVVAIMQNRVEELTKLSASEGGKPYQDSKVEINRAINGVKLAIAQIGNLKGEQVPLGQTRSSVNRLAFTLREPIGAVVSVSAFNHPLNLIIHQTVPAIAVGAPVIVKPASTTPLSCRAFMEILEEAGLPSGWCQMVICDQETAERMVTDRRVNYFSFIGSGEVGWHLRSQLAPGTRCALEHGGVAPVIVAGDADLREMIPELIKGGFYHAGQVCVSVQKIFVNEMIVKEVAELLAESAAKLKVGDPLDAATEVGPLILPAEVDRVEAWVNEAVEMGAELLCGGRRISDVCYAPTVLLNPPAEAKVSKLEVFGPVVCVYSYQEREKVILLANSLPYAFQAAVYTQNLDIALDTVNRLNASAVMVNDHTAFRVDWMPFGGRDASGIGVGGIPYSMQEMTREKLVVIKSKSIK